MKTPRVMALAWTIAIAYSITVVARAEEAFDITAVPVEMERLAGFAGEWETTVQYRFTPDAKTFESKSVETTQWSPNHRFLLSDQRGLMPDGWKNQLVITTWDAAKREYKLVSVVQGGEVVERTMVIEGTVERVLYYRPLGDRLIRSELTLERTSPSQYKFREECTDEGRTWVFCEGISTKVR